MKSMYKQLVIALLLAVTTINLTYAVTPPGRSVTPAIVLQGGSDSVAKWLAPVTSAHKVHVFVPKAGTVVNALYRVYPKGKRANSTKCVTTDAKYPCYEVTVDQTLHQNAWVQLMQNDDAATQWQFVKNRGFVVAVADNLDAAELLNVSTQVRFENMTIAIGKTYQGGIIFYVDNTGGHGLVAAPKDQSSGIRWYNGSYITTGATGTAVGTGLANTTKIITAQGAGSYAAQLCADLVIGTYSDWYLPSKDELNLMYKNIGQGAAAPLTNVGGFAGAWYWSSSEYGNLYAWSQLFGSGDLYYNYKYYLKGYPGTVRAVRAF